MLKFGPPEHVYVENVWYDSPRDGVADVNGVPHRYKWVYDYADDQYLGTFMVWPIDKGEFELEVEHWRIYVEWNQLHESGLADACSHPGDGGRNARWDELQDLLEESRSEVPATATPAVAQLSHIDREVRDELSGPAYMLSWSLL